MKGLTWSSNFLSQISCMLALSLFQLHYLPWQLLECVVSLSKWGSYGFHPAFSSWATFPGHCLLGHPLQHCQSALLCHQQGRQSSARLQHCPSFSKGKVSRQHLSHFQSAWGITGSCEPIPEPWFSSNPVTCSWNDEKAAPKPVSKSSKFGYPDGGCSRAHPAQMYAGMRFWVVQCWPVFVKQLGRACTAASRAGVSATAAQKLHLRL